MNKETMYSVDVEQAVLGSLLIDNDKIDLANKIALDDFYLPQHKIIANAIIELVNKGKPADLVTVCEYINETQLDSCGGLAYIAELAKNTPTALNFKHYFDILRNYTKTRKLKTVIDTTLSHLGKNVFANTNSSNDLITKLESDLFSLANEYHKTDMLSVPNLLDNIVDFLQSDDSPFIPTGFDD